MRTIPAKIIICPACKGEGVVGGYSYRPGPITPIKTGEEKKDCKACAATGFLVILDTKGIEN